MSLEAHVGVRQAAFTLDAEIVAHPGEMVVVVGPNGAGKTTLLRALAGFVPLAHGHVAIDGVVVADVERGLHRPPERRPVGVVFQEGLLFPHLSARKNVAFGLRARGMGRREALARADAWLERLGLADRASSRPGELSGGERQRVALARALVTGPRLLLLDEPLAAVDAAARGDLQRLLRDHLADYPGVCLLVTHDPVEAAVLGDRLVVLEEGAVVQEGRLAEIATRPRSPWVARMLGLNVLRGRATSGGLDVGEVTLAVVSDVRGEAMAIVHPRAVTLHRARPDGSARNRWPGRVERVDSLGDRVRVRIAGPVPLVAEVTPAAVVDLCLETGSEVWVAVKATEIDVFPV